MMRRATENLGLQYVDAKEVVQTDLEKAEAKQVFVQAALRSREHLKNTGLHITQDEFSAWVQAIQENPKAPMPASHV